MLPAIIRNIITLILIIKININFINYMNYQNSIKNLYFEKSGDATF